MLKKMTIDGQHFAPDDGGDDGGAYAKNDDGDDWQLLLIDVRGNIPVNFDFRYSIDGLHWHYHLPQRLLHHHLGL